MSKPTFRREAVEDVSRLLEHWRVVERSIKRAEQINGKAVIPAINELRYAARQLIVAGRVLYKHKIGLPEQSIIRKRLIIAEQYLLNADHDVIDGSITFYRREIIRLNQEFGVGDLAKHYPHYPAMCEIVEKCETLIEETRHDYDKRKPNYNAIRTNHLETLIDAHRGFENAEVGAKFERAELERQIKIKNKTINTLSVVSTIASILGIISFPLSIYLAFATWGVHADFNWDWALTWYPKSPSQ